MRTIIDKNKFKITLIKIIDIRNFMENQVRQVTSGLTNQMVILS